MATKKRIKNKQKKSKRTARKKEVPMKKTAKKKLAKKRVTPKQQLAKKAAPKRAPVKARVRGKKTSGGKTAGTRKKQVQGKSRSVKTVPLAPEGLKAQTGKQSGDLQELSNVQGANSESVEELLEQGNAFEAEVVKGVEDAGEADKREVCTHEVPQDDVPEEYLDKKD